MSFPVFEASSRHTVENWAGGPDSSGGGNSSDGAPLGQLPAELSGYSPDQVKLICLSQVGTGVGSGQRNRQEPNATFCHALGLDMAVSSSCCGTASSKMFGGQSSAVTALLAVTAELRLLDCELGWCLLVSNLYNCCVCCALRCTLLRATLTGLRPLVALEPSSTGCPEGGPV
jgi:hypothetical protein